MKFPGPVRRVRIRSQKGEWRVIKEVEIASMTLRQSAKLPATRKGQGVSGFWVEAVDDKGRVLYRSVAENPFQPNVEVFDASGAPRRADVPQDEYTFDILIPDLPEITHLVVYSDLTEEGKRRPKADVLQRLPLARRGGKGEDYGRE